MTDRDPFARWLEAHPRTLGFIAFVAVGEFILALLEVLK